MIHTLKLLLPALIPSWNFFDVIAASPRIEYTLLRAPDETPGAWIEFRPRPDRVSLHAMLGRLFWNARWNETLFVVSCAGRLMDEPTEHSEREIFHRIAADLADRRDETFLAPQETWLSFRIALLSEQRNAIGREIGFVAAPRRAAAISTRRLHI